jgi:hypothetical protein
MGKTINSYKNLIGKPRGKSSFGRLKHRWYDSIGMHLKEIG